MNLLKNISEYLESRAFDPEISGIGMHSFVYPYVLNSIKSGTCAYRTRASGDLKTTPDELYEYLKTSGGTMVLSDCDNSSSQTLWLWEDCVVDAYVTHATDEDDDDSSTLKCMSDNKARFDEISGKLSEFISQGTLGKVYTLVMGKNGPTVSKLGSAGVEFRSDNYSPEVVTAFKHVESDISKADPCGRITIIDGPPGTGKTYLIRSLLNDVAAQFIIIPPDLVEQLAGPTLVSALIAHKGSSSGLFSIPGSTSTSKPMVLIIEDADSCLVPREQSNMSAISAILNMSDGIMGSVLNIRLIATTNAGHLSNSGAIDPAITRPGRLCRKIEVGPLSAKQANERLQQLAPGSPCVFTKPTTLAEVYAYVKNPDGDGRVSKPKTLGFGS